jgi:hypothetical protein
MSAEDAWPKWLNTLIDSQQPRKTTTYIGTTDGFSKQLDGLGGVLPRKTNEVCRTCNNGWMSELEARVKPILAPLVEGKRITLSADEQQLLAVWAIKTALTTQRTIPNESVWPPSYVYDAIREQRPPTGYRVYAAEVFGQGTDAGLPLRWDGTKSASLAGVDHNVFVTVLMAGSVLFQVIGDFRRDKSGGLPPIMANHVQRIWPNPQALDWPTRSFPRGLVPMMVFSIPVEREGTHRVGWMPADPY